MPYLTVEDLGTHLYSEIITEITRDKPGLTDKAISAAIAEAKSYLGKFDLLKLFGTSDATAAVEDEALKNKVKDITCWHLIKLANPNVSMELFRTLYEDAIKWLEKVAKGLIDPDGWPYKPVDPQTGFPQGASVYGSYNRKRPNHF